MSYTNKKSQNIFLSSAFEEKPCKLNSEQFEKRFFESNSKLEEIEKYEKNFTENIEKVGHSPTNEVCIETEERSPYGEKQTSSEILSEPISKLKNLCIDNQTQSKNRNKRRVYKTQPRNLIVSLRYGKRGRRTKSRRFFPEVTKATDKLQTDKKKVCLQERKLETPKKGKRGHLGGKAKCKPPNEEILNNYDSDEDAENFYFYRISLGHFQKLKNDSGASTSNQYTETLGATSSKYSKEKLKISNSDEIETELLELERWGRSSFNVYSKMNSEMKKLNEVNLNQKSVEFGTKDVENGI